MNPEARIETTNICNLRCTVCPRERLTRKQTVMQYYLFTDIIDQLDHETIQLTGFGEPLIDPGIGDKIRYCKSKGKKVFITTNATLLGCDKSYELLSAGIDHVRISAHGVFENYQAVHNYSFTELQRNAFNFIKINQTVYDSQCKVDVVAVSGDVKGVKNYWGDLVDDLEIWTPHNWTDGREYRKLDKKKQTCGRPFNGPVQVTADGKMITCCFDYNGTLELGDLTKNSVKEILTGKKLKEIQKKHRGNLKGLICEKCDQLNNNNALIYSTNPNSEVGKTSSIKFKL